MKRLILAAFILVVALAMPARAGEIATLEPIGFSADGAVFAFEEHGIQDGSGFPYANLYFLDLAEDSFLSPSPVRIRIDDDRASVETAQKQARERASALFRQFSPDRHPGRAVVSNPATELSADPHQAEFLPRWLKPSPDRSVVLRLEEFPLAAGGLCADIGEQTKGYRLLKTVPGSGKPATLLHEDKTIPKSRKCPLSYRLSEVRVLEKPNSDFSAVAIIGVESLGFEGPDIRFIATPVPLNWD